MFIDQRTRALEPYNLGAGKEGNRVGRGLGGVRVGGGIGEVILTGRAVCS